MEKCGVPVAPRSLPDLLVKKRQAFVAGLPLADFFGQNKHLAKRACLGMAPSDVKSSGWT
jgi:hypothetical protein